MGASLPEEGGFCVSTSVLNYHHERLPQWVQLLRTIVGHESPTDDKAFTDMLGLFLKAALERVGASVSTIPQPAHGDFLRAEFGSGTEGQILMLCHIDTVWPRGEIQRRPVFERDGKNRHHRQRGRRGRWNTSERGCSRSPRRDRSAGRYPRCR